MSERREPTISSMPDDAREDFARARAKSAALDPHTPPPRATPSPVSSRPIVVRSPLGPITLILLLVVGCFAGYSFWLLTKTQASLQSTTTQLVQTEQRVADLEKRLMLSDDESTQSITVIQAKVKENASEIRKLWGVAYDRNRKAIADLEEVVKKLQVSLAGVDGEAKKALQDVSGDLKVVGELVEAQQTAISKFDQASKVQGESVSRLQQQFTTLDSDLKKRVLAAEEAIKSIDSFRVQVNRELLKLKGS